MICHFDDDNFLLMLAQKICQKICVPQKSSIFAPLLSKCTGLWCNGNTADSGPAFPGSSPGSPAKKRDATCASLFCPIGDSPLWDNMWS